MTTSDRNFFGWHSVWKPMTGIHYRGSIDNKRSQFLRVAFCLEANGWHTLARTLFQQRPILSTNMSCTKSGSIYCFRANYELSTNFDPDRIPDWLSLGTNWQGYRISTVPWVADVARVLGALNIEDTPEAWVSHLESLGLKEVCQVGCEDLYEDTLFF